VRGNSHPKSWPKKASYFRFCLEKKQYYYLEKCGDHICNLSLFLMSRYLTNIVYFTSDPLGIVAARSTGHQYVPIAPWDNSEVDDYQLCLVENYLLRIVTLKDRHFSEKIRADFSFLTDIDAEGGESE
jgi:hypothetical protein